MNETELLKQILPLLPKRDDVLEGAGDDAAVINCGGTLLLAASDQLIGDVHFFSNSTPPYLAGAKLLKRNLSDIAAMGGEPAWALTNIAAKDIDDKWLIEFNRGIAEVAKSYNIAVVGGDISSLKSSGFVSSLTILGSVEAEKLCLRNRAKVGDLVLVTGTLGDSLATEHHLNFTPRLAESRILAGHFTNCMMDISDGLGLDAKRLAEASNVQIALRTNQLPPRGNATTKAMLTDGEDYELLFTLDPKKLNELLSVWNLSTKLTIIGEVRDEVVGRVTDWDNRIIDEEYYGFEHFKN